MEDVMKPATLLRRVTMVAILALNYACTDVEPLAPVQMVEIIFLAQTLPPGVVMEALFQGRVFVDPAGCVRLNTNDQHTVVWPHGTVLLRRGDDLLVRSSDGRDLGRLGGSFRFGGGEVPSLHAGIALSHDTRQRASTECPGRYWIVGDTD
jgi:hypothetical protein